LGVHYKVETLSPLSINIPVIESGKEEKMIYHDVIIEDYEIAKSKENELEMKGKLLKVNGIASSERPVVYYMGMIDILQKYDFSKKLERFTKVYLLRKNKEGVSAQPVEPYCKRFIRQISARIE